MIQIVSIDIPPAENKYFLSLNLILPIAAVLDFVVGPVVGKHFNSRDCFIRTWKQKK